MTPSIVITTCAARTGKPQYERRAYALRNFILPLYAERGWRVVVAGEWEPGPGYRYVRVPSVTNDIWDAIRQRVAGLAATTGDLVVLQSDDHVFSPNLSDVEALMADADVLVPERRTRMRTPDGERLNGGECEAYVPFHGAVYRRTVLERVPYTAVVDWPLDTAHTAALRAIGARILHTSNVTIWDVEQGAHPWD